MFEKSFKDMVKTVKTTHKTWRLKRKEARQTRILAENLQFKEITFHSANSSCEFARLCDKYGSDKGGLPGVTRPYSWPPHSYSYLYTRLFSHCRGAVSSVFEYGLGTNNPQLKSSMGVLGRPGASLRVWRDYFPNAEVVGADIDRGILFSENRIRSDYIDQTDEESIAEFWGRIDLLSFDLMVDDGLHTFEAGRTLFENSVHRLSKHGVYVIEDCGHGDLLAYKNYFSNRDFFVEFVLMHRPGLLLGDNSAVVIKKRA